MDEFTNLDRCAAYVAARAALLAIHSTTGSWPLDLADRTRRAAVDTIHVTTAALAHSHGSADRRRCLRDAITSALRVAALVDDAGAMGFSAGQLAHVQRTAGRSIAMLCMLLHASTAPIADSV